MRGVFALAASGPGGLLMKDVTGASLSFVVPRPGYGPVFVDAAIEDGCLMRTVTGRLDGYALIPLEEFSEGGSLSFQCSKLLVEARARWIKFVGLDPDPSRWAPNVVVSDG